MRITTQLSRIVVIALLFLLLGVAVSAQAQERITIQANARGTSTQLGKLYSVNIIIEQLSTPAEQKILIDAFAKSGHDGLVDALEHMNPKGRLAFTGTVGNDVKYIREFPSEDGRRRFRLVTDRNVRIAEMRQGTRSEDYSISAVELFLTPDGKGTGKLLPSCKLTVNKKKQIEIEAFQNPWDLTDLLVYYKKK